jgi:hypothetical protein
MIEIHDNRKLDLIIRQEIPFAGSFQSIYIPYATKICNLKGIKKAS